VKACLTTTKEIHQLCAYFRTKAINVRLKAIAIEFLDWFCVLDGYKPLSGMVLKLTIKSVQLYMFVYFRTNNINAILEATKTIPLKRHFVTSLVLHTKNIP